MDRSGEGLTKAGKICGIVSVVLWSIWIVLYLLMMVLGIGMAAVSGAGGAGTP